MRSSAARQAGIDRVVTALDVLGNVVRLIGLVLTIPGLWLMAGGLRVVVSGRIDERRRSAQSVKWGILLSIVGTLLLFGGTWLANWARS